MAAITGVAGVLTAAAGAVTEVTGWSFDESATAISDTNLNDAAESNLGGRTSWSGSVEVMWDKANSGGQGAITIGSIVAFVFYPEGNSGGLTTYTGSAVVTGRSQTVSDDAMIVQSFSLTGSGALVAGTV